MPWRDDALHTLQHLSGATLTAILLQICVPGESGRLFTLFLTSPVTAMAALVKLENPDGLLLATCQVGNPI